MPNPFRREAELPPELKGKDLNEVAKQLKDADALKARLDVLEAERKVEKDGVTQMQTSFNEMRQKLQEIEANRNTPPPRTTTPNEPADWLTEPDRAFNERSAPLANLAVNTAMQSAKLIAQQQLNNQDSVHGTMNGRLFLHWENEIQQRAQGFIKNGKSVELTSPDAWINIFTYIKGQHADELANPDARKKNFAFLESGRPNVAAQVDNSTKTPSDQLTDEEKHVADRMHVSHENYLKRKQSMRFANV